MSLTEKENSNIKFLTDEAYRYFSDDYSGHDFNHTERVLENAIKLQAAEGGNLYIIELAALLHDFDDIKISYATSENKANAERLLRYIGEEDELIKAVKDIIDSVSFSKGKSAVSLEAKIVQDADRLDAIGAIGIARCFAYGASRARPIYYDKNFISDKIDGCDSGIAHFYAKLLKIEEKMQTETGRRLASERTEFIRIYLKELYDELNNNK